MEEPILGRDRELAELRAGLVAQAGRLVLVGGEAGIGKTRLAAAAAAMAGEYGIPVARGQAVDDPGMPPLCPWRRVARDVPPLHAVLTDAHFDPADSTARFAMIADATDALVAAGPLLVVLEDLHWADRTSLRLLAHVAGELSSARILVVATYRDADGPFAEVLPDLVRAPATRVLRLAGLTSEDVAGWGRGVTGVADPESLAARLVDGTGGNPLYVRMLLDRVTDDGELTVHPELDRLVLSRLDVLSPRAREVLCAASVLGERIEPALLAAVTGEDPAALLDSAVAARVVRVGDSGMAFTHALVRDAIYQDLAPSVRGELHRRCAVALAAGGGAPGRVATQWSLADGPDAAEECTRWASAAARAATADLAYDDAVRFAALALASAERAPVGSGSAFAAGEHRAVQDDASAAQDPALGLASPGQGALGHRAGLSRDPASPGQGALGHRAGLSRDPASPGQGALGHRAGLSRDPASPGEAALGHRAGLSRDPASPGEAALGHRAGLSRDPASPGQAALGHRAGLSRDPASPGEAALGHRAGLSRDPASPGEAALRHRAGLTRDPTSPSQAALRHRAALTLDLARAEFLADDAESSLTHCRTAARLAQDAAAPELIAEAALVITGLGDPSLLVAVDQLCVTALAHLPAEATALRARLLARRAMAATTTGACERARELSGEALDLATGSGDPDAELDGVHARHLTLCAPQFRAERVELAHRAVELAETARQPHASLWGHVWLVDAAFQAGDLAAVDRELASIEQFAAARQHAVAWWHLHRLRATRAALVGRLDLARQHNETARSLAERIGVTAAIGMYHAFEQGLAQVAGAIDAGVARESFQAVNQIGDIALARVTVPLMHALLGDLEQARATFEEFRGMPREIEVGPMWAPLLSQIGDIACLLGDTETADLVYTRLSSLEPGFSADGSGAVFCTAASPHLLGDLAMTC